MDHRNEDPTTPGAFAARRAAQPPATTSRRPYAYNADSASATCRTCHHSQTDLTPQQAGPWHAGHQRTCTGSPRPATQDGKILPFRQ